MNWTTEKLASYIDRDGRLDDKKLLADINIEHRERCRAEDELKKVLADYLVAKKQLDRSIDREESLHELINNLQAQLKK
jgi:hypothetical protein